MSLKTKIHEWLADHVNWVQYPNVHVSRSMVGRPENGLSIEARFGLFCFGVIGVIVGSAATIVFFMVLFHLLKEIFS